MFARGQKLKSLLSDYLFKMVCFSHLKFEDCRSNGDADHGHSKGTPCLWIENTSLSVIPRPRGGQSFSLPNFNCSLTASS